MPANGKRKIVYFLGAGASLGAGAYTQVQGGGKIYIPTQANFWRSFLRLASSRENASKIESFLFRYFKGYQKVPGKLSVENRRKLLSEIDVEEVFTFLSERCRAPSTSPALRTYAAGIWSILVHEIGYVFRKFTANANTKKIYKQMLDSQIRAWDAVVSFNYDTVFEDSLPKGRQWGYDGVNAMAHGLRVLKPHGSVNWSLSKGVIEVGGSPSEPLIVAPTHLKFISSGTDAEQDTGSGDSDGYLDRSEQVSDIWHLMEKHMSAAKCLVFIGYSFPMADLYFSSVLRSILTTMSPRPRIVVVNPDAMAIQGRLRTRFSLDNITSYFTLEQFCQSPRV